MRSLKPVFSIKAILAFISPYIAVGSGLFVSWLFVHVHWLGVFHINQSSAARVVAGAVVFTVTSGLTYAAAHFHWLPISFQALEQRQAAKQQAAVAPGGSATGAAATPAPPTSPGRP